MNLSADRELFIFTFTFCDLIHTSQYWSNILIVPWWNPKERNQPNIKIIMSRQRSFLPGWSCFHLIGNKKWLPRPSVKAKSAQTQCPQWCRPPVNKWHHIYVSCFLPNLTKSSICDSACLRSNLLCVSLICRSKGERMSLQDALLFPCKLKCSHKMMWSDFRRLNYCLI